MNSADLLTSFDSCPVAGFWDRDWKYDKVTLNELLHDGIRAGVMSDRKDFGEVAGEAVVGICSERRILSDNPDAYATSIHHGAIADIVSCALRKPSEPPWTVPEITNIDGLEWNPGCFLSPSGTRLRRIVLVTAWSDSRHYEEARSWRSIGEVCAYGMPMQEAVIVLGTNRAGRRHGFWSRGYRHPKNRTLRLQRKNFIGRGFNENWMQIFREDFDDISTSEWLAQMAEDNVLKDVAFSVTIDVPPPSERQRILDLAKAKLERLYSMTEEPEKKLVGCHWPIECPHAFHCDKNLSPSEKIGYARNS